MKETSAVSSKEQCLRENKKLRARLVKAEEALFLTKAEWERTFDSVPDLIAVLDREHKIVRVNSSMATRLGLKPEECAGLQCFRAVHGTDAPPSFCPHTLLLADGRAHSSEMHEDRLGGDFLVSTTPLCDVGGAVIGSVHVARDITEQKRAEAELQAAKNSLERRVKERTNEVERARAAVDAERQRLYDILEALPAYVVLLREDYHVPFANRFFRERFGESNGKRCFEYLFNRTEPCENCETFMVLKSASSHHHWEWLGPDGRNYDINDYLIRDTDGSPLIMEMGIDITEHKNTQKELIRTRDNLEEAVKERTRDLVLSQESLRNLYASMTEGVANHEIVYENGAAVDYIITDVNPAYERITGLSKSQAVGRTASELYESGQPPYLDIYAKVASGGEPEDFETFFPPMNKHFSISVFSPEKGKFATVFSDITLRKQAEERLAYIASFPESNPNPIVEVDYSGAIKYLNPRAKELFQDIADSGFGHPFLSGLEQILKKINEENVPVQLVNEVRVAGRYYQQTIVNMPESRIIRLYSMDISERKAADSQKEAVLAALRESEAKLNRAQEIARLGSWELDVAKNILSWSDEVYRIFGLQPQEFDATYEAFIESVHPDDRAGVDGAYSGSLREGRDSYEIEHRIIRRSDGEIRHVHERCEHIRNAAGVVVRSVGMVHDITERKKAEAALIDLAAQKQASQYARSLIEVSIDPLVTISANGKITDVNEATVKATGVPRGELIGTDFFRYFTEPEKAEQGYLQVFALGAVTDYQLTIKHRNGQLMDVLYNASLYKDAQGKVLGVFAAARDISARKQAFQYARSLIEVSIDPLVTISANGKITDVNEATVKATGVPRNELIGTDFSRYFTEPEKAEQGYQQVFALGTVTDYPLTICHKNGQMMDVLYNASLYKDTQGKILGVFAAARDVTEQKKAEAELKRHRDNLEDLVKERTRELDSANKELKRSNENLEQFAYVASHDLQEPLRTMSSYAQLLDKRYKDRLDADANEFIGYIVDAASRMQKLIMDLLAYSRAGHTATQIKEVDCNLVFQRVVKSMEATVKSVGAGITCDKLPVVRAHETGILQLFQNLIVNSLKFQGKQAPLIHMSAHRENGEWVFTVRDNGIGIEPQYHQRIFQIFQRLHQRDAYPGTGIGLAICKKIVENHGGRIWVESEPGKGTSFFFTIPG